MTDVRLTATNPEDSSVVPVACNSRGELLVTEPVINEIDNDVTINGALSLVASENEIEKWRWRFNRSTGGVSLYDLETSNLSYAIESNGNVELVNYSEDGAARVRVCYDTYAILVKNYSGANTFRVDWSGITRTNKLELPTEADKSEHYSSIKNAETGEEITEYIGPVVDVGEELAFLRAQVRALMEKLKMTPEGGWPVWDGSAET